MWTPESVIVAARHQVSCDIGGGETAILQLNSGIYYGLNPVGSRVWQLIQEPRVFADLHKTLVQEYEVSLERAACDLRDLCDKLAGAGLIECESSSC